MSSDLKNIIKVFEEKIVLFVPIEFGSKYLIPAPPPEEA